MGGSQSETLLGGSWVLVSRVIRRVAAVIALNSGTDNPT